MKKYVYIKRDISKHYVEFDEMMNPELYNNLGETWLDYVDNKWVLLSDEQVAFRDEHPNASVKEVWEMQLTPTPARTLEQAKSEKIRQIEEYDRSGDVNGFTVNNEIEGWFTADERSNHKSSIDAAKLLGMSALTFYIGDMLLEVTPTQAEYMLAQIQLYADQCYIVTKQHKIAVEALETIADVDSYDYTQGYPSKIDFTYPIEVS